MNKVYTRISWENYPSEKTAVNESNLNKMDSALNEIDTRVVEHETTKANVASLNNLIDNWVIDETTGIITIHKVSGEQIIFDLNIEKVPVGFSMTEDGILIMTTEDGTEFTANIGSMIPVITFNDSEQIAVSVSGEGANKTYTFTIKTGSITEDKLQPNFLADCRLYAGNAENSATLAGEYAQQAKESAESISNKAGDISFDDSTAQLGSDNVQGAIEANTASIEATKKVETGTLGKPITTGTYGNEMLMKKDGIVYLSCRLLSTSVTGYTTVWAILPEGFRPKEPTHLMGSAIIGGTRMPILVYINTFGAIQQSYGSVEATELTIGGSFIAAE